jgi:hypothetical protein
MNVTATEIKKRKINGLPRLNGVSRADAVVPHPSRGGSRGYEYNYRVDQLNDANQGLETKACGRTIRRWRNQLIPLKITGNKNEVKIRGIDLCHLVMYRMTYPKVTSDEMRAFIFRSNYLNPVLYSRVDIVNAEAILEITRKRASTTAYQALEPYNQWRRYLFRTLPPPVGVLNVERASLLDADECGLFLTTCNRLYGKSYKSVRVRESGPYGHNEKWTLIMIIGPNGWKHATFRQVNGTNADDFLHFIQTALQRLALLGLRKVFLWDNLASHFTPQVIDAIYAAGHSIIARPPYYPCDGPIEYVFNEIEMSLRDRLYIIRTHEDLVINVHAIIGDLGANFDATFRHCGY